MELYDVIYFKSVHPSFSWNNGLFVVVKINNNELGLAKLRDGQLDRYENKDGAFDNSEFKNLNVCYTGLNNPGVLKTNMKYHNFKL